MRVEILPKILLKTNPQPSFIADGWGFAYIFCYFVSFLPFLPWRSRMMKRVGVPSNPNTSRIWLSI